MGHQRIAINNMCEEDKIEGLHHDGEITVTNAHRYIIYGGESEMLIDTQSMVVNLKCL